MLSGVRGSRRSAQVRHERVWVLTCKYSFMWQKVAHVSVVHRTSFVQQILQHVNPVTWAQILKSLNLSSLMLNINNPPDLGRTIRTCGR